MEDPLPLWSGPQFATGEPRKQQPPWMGGGQQPETPKADLKPLFKSLGLELDAKGVVWSDYNPSAQFKYLPAAFVWCMRDRGCIADSSITTGIDSMLFPWAGMLYESKEKSPDLKVIPLARPAAKPRWGQDTFSDYVMSMMGNYRPSPEPPRHFGNKVGKGDPPALAVEITGIMPSAYPKDDPKAKKEDKKDEAKKDDVAKQDGDKKDEAKKDDKDSTKPEPKKGVPSAKPVHVIVIADTDFANDQFFQIYRNVDNQLGKDELAVLRNLRNVQFVANAVDSLAADEDFMKVRTRRPQPRPLARLESVLVNTEQNFRDRSSQAEQEAEEALAKANSDFQAKQEKVESESDLDEVTKAQKKQMIAESERRKLDIAMDEIKRKRDVNIALAKGQRNEEIKDQRGWVRMQAVGIPAIFMITLVLAVLFNRLRQERRHIPSSRKRAQP
jgi:hypothetical protein